MRIENGNYDALGITDPNVPASLLKYWLRDLTEPIIGTEYYYDCIQHAEDVDKALAIINRLPDTNRRIALFIINFLQVTKKKKKKIIANYIYLFIGIYRSSGDPSYADECQ